MSEMKTLEAVKPAPHLDEDHEHEHHHDHDHEHGEHEGHHHGTAPTFLPHWMQERWTLVLISAAGIFYLIGWIGGSYLGLSPLLANLFFVLAYIAGGYDVTLEAIPELLKGKFNTDLLMILAALGAATLGELREGAFLLFLFSLGHAGEHYALDRARNSVRALGSLTPKIALTRRDGHETELLVEQLLVGDVVIVMPGARLPVDGEILLGRSGVDQSPITGESVPVDKESGDLVYAGSINGEGALEVRVTRLAKDNTLARVMRMVEEAEAQQSPTQQAVNKFERVFVPAVLIVTALVIIVPPLLFSVPFALSFSRAMMLLVAASPCALALGTPAAILAGIAQAARNGILIKGGVHLENLGRLNAIAFDKTGTITHGRPEVTDVIRLNSQTEAELLALAAALETRSGHPLAKAVVRAAKSQNLVFPTLGEVESLTGRGLKTQLNNQVIYLGNLRLLDEAKINVTSEFRKQIEEMENSGKTSMVLAIGSEVVGIIGLADTIRPNISKIMSALNQIGVKETVMLTGDNPRAAAAIARQAGLTDVRADLMPENKVEAVRELKAKHQITGMVGDGVNDAPALANATIGIAMGGAGTDVALETADVALMGDDLSKLPFAVKLGRATRMIIVQNLGIALGVIVFLIITSLFGLATLGAAVVLHEGSTIVVVLNALRLLGVREDATLALD